MAEDDTTINLKGLEQLVKTLKAKPPRIRIGILGDSSRSDGSASNAEIGAAHEFGNSKVPMRSFLRVPLMERLEKELESSGAFTPDAMAAVIRSGTLMPWVKKVAVVAEGIVAGAFDSGGYGEWPPVTPETAKHKKVDMILVETQQLRNSISTEITEE